MNPRWKRLVVNVIGDGIRDCSQVPSPDRTNCRRLIDTVRYTLVHHGPFVGTDGDGNARLLPLREMSVPGEAYANGVVVNLPETGLEGPLFQTLVRPNLLGYPLGGVYELVLTPKIGQEFSKIEGVQILLDGVAWSQ